MCRHHPQAHYHNTRHGPSQPPRLPTSADSAFLRAARRWRPQTLAGCSGRTERPPIKPKSMVLEAASAQKLGLQHLRAQEAHASTSEGRRGAPSQRVTALSSRSIGSDGSEVQGGTQLYYGMSLWTMIARRYPLLAMRRGGHPDERGAPLSPIRRPGCASRGR